MMGKETIEQIQKLPYMKGLLWGGGLTVTSLLIGWLLYSYGREGFIDPLAEQLWRIYIALQMLSQETLWGMLLAVAALNFVFLLLRIGIALPQPTYQPPMVGRVAKWLELLQVAGQPGFFGKQLIGAVRKLIVIDLIIRNNQTEADARRQIRAGELPFSSAARELLGHYQPPGANPALHDHRLKKTTITIINELAAYLENNEVNDES